MPQHRCFKNVSHCLKTRGQTRDRTPPLDTVYPERACREARAAKEVVFRERIAAGEAPYDLLGIRAKVADLGIEEKDGTWLDDR